MRSKNMSGKNGFVQNEETVSHEYLAGYQSSGSITTTTLHWVKKLCGHKIRSVLPDDEAMMPLFRSKYCLHLV